jgi:hypothetical protein
VGKRKFPYRCRYCNCFLDPGEGDVCTDCQEEQEQAEEGGQKMEQDNYGLSALERLEGEYVVTGVCPFCGMEYDFRCITFPEDDLLKKWAVQRCACIEAQLERMAQAEARRETRRVKDDTY